MYVKRTYFTHEVPSTDASRAWTLVSTPCLWVSSRVSWDVKMSSKQSATNLAFRTCDIIPRGPWIAVAPTAIHGPSLFISDFTIDHKSLRYDLTVPCFCFHRSSAFLGVICLKFLVTQLRPFYMMDHGLLTTVSLTSACILADSSDTVDPYLGPRVQICLSIVCML
jgi:hypothetical protein